MDETGQEAGFTLLELVIALGILSVAVGGLISVLGAALRTTAIDVHRTDAVALATKELASLRRASPGTVNAPPDHQATINGESYTVSDTVGWQRSSGGSDQAYRFLTVAVTWADQGGAHTVEQDSARYQSPAVASNAPTGACTAASSAVAPSAASSGGSTPALDVTWTEPASATALARWEIDTAPDGTAWTTNILAEPPLTPGAVHVVELGGLAPNVGYYVRIGGFGECGPASWSSVLAPSVGVPGVTCLLGAVTLGTPVAARATAGSVPGALAQDVVVAVASGGPCSGGLWAGVTTTAGSAATVALETLGPGLYGGVIPGTTKAWDLGRHLVEIFAGSPPSGPLPTTLPLAVAELCIQPDGTTSC